MVKRGAGHEGIFWSDVGRLGQGGGHSFPRRREPLQIRERESSSSPGLTGLRFLSFSLIRGCHSRGEERGWAAPGGRSKVTVKPPNLLQGLAQGGVGGGSSLLWTQVTESRGVCREFKSNKMDSGLGYADPEVYGNAQSGKRTRTGEHTISKVLFFRLQNTSSSSEHSLSGPGTGNWNLVSGKRRSRRREGWLEHLHGACSHSA